MSFRMGVAILVSGCVGPGSDDAITVEWPSVTDVQWSVDSDFIGPITVSWNQSSPATMLVEYEVDGVWQGTHVIDAQAGANEATVVGVPLGEESPYRIVFADDPSQVVQEGPPLKNQPPPADLWVGELLVPEAAQGASSGPYLLIPLTEGVIGEDWVAIFDRQLRPVWARPANTPVYSTIASSGDHLIWGQVLVQRARLFYLDQRIGTFALDGFYHALVEHDGLFVWPAFGREGLQERDSGTGQRIVTEEGSGYVNGIDYDEERNWYVVSNNDTRQLSAVDRATGAVVWQSATPDLPADGDRVYGFDPPQSAFRNPHGLELLSNGNLLVADDVGNGPGEDLGAREYVIDDDGKMLRMVWEHRLDLRMQAPYSWVHRLPNGNTLLTGQYYDGDFPPLGGTVVEVTSDNEVAWRAEFFTGGVVGRAQVIDDLYDLVAPPGFGE